MESNSSKKVNQDLNKEINEKETESIKTTTAPQTTKTTSNSSNSSGLSFIPGGVGGMLGGGGLNIDALLGQQSQVVKTMTSALLNLTEAQAKFLEALGEKRGGYCSKDVCWCFEKGEAIGKDDLEKALIRTKESQAIIEKKMLEVNILT